MQRWALAILSSSLAATGASALSFNIGNGAREIYLRVGDTGGTVAVVSINLTGSEAILGNGTPIYGTVAATSGAVNAETPNFAACPANYVRIVARARGPGGNPISATLQATSSTALIHAASGNTIPFTQIGWDSDDAAEFPSGSFTGGTQVISPIVVSSKETGACHRFKFLNTVVYPPSVGGLGYYQGTVTYNLNAP